MSESKLGEAHVRGAVQLLPLAGVQPNTWNPNRVPDHVMRSIEHGFRTDGWLVSNALLVWGTDDAGTKRNTIIDGEHKWRAACAVGLEAGPMVVLDGISEAEAKALTIKMNQKRGDWDEAALAPLLQELQGLVVDTPALDFGFDDAQLAVLLSVEPVEVPLVLGPQPEAVKPPQYVVDAHSTRGNAAVRVTQLVYTEDEHAAFAAAVKRHAAPGEAVAMTVLRVLGAEG